MKTKFYLEPSRVGVTKASLRHLGLMKWMAAMVKTLQIPSSQKQDD